MKILEHVHSFLTSGKFQSDLAHILRVLFDFTSQSSQDNCSRSRRDQRASLVGIVSCGRCRCYKNSNSTCRNRQKEGHRFPHKWCC